MEVSGQRSKKNQGRKRSVVPFIGSLDAEKNLRRRHLLLHEGSRLKTMTAWHHVHLRPDTNPTESGQSFHHFQESLKPTGLCCPDSDTCHSLRPTCLPQIWFRQPSFQDQVVLLTWPPWCRSSWPACPPCSHPWRKQPGSTRRTRPGVEQKDKVLLRGGRDTNTRTQTQSFLHLECAFPSFFNFFFSFCEATGDPIIAGLPWETAEIFMAPTLEV